MSLPFESLVTTQHQLGLVVAVLIGFGFGFALERGGFGQATKLAGQFYLRDMTVFKVMFSAIVTAMLGMVVADGLGIVDIASLSRGAVSYTYVLPMLVGGFILGVGFITAGYCPGTSMVSAASGNLDGVVTVLGVVLGSVLYGEVFPLIQGFHSTTELGHVFLYEALGVSPALLAAVIAVVAVALFVGAEKVERIFGKDKELHPWTPAPSVGQRRAAFAGFGAVALVGLGVMVIPIEAQSSPPRTAHSMDVATLAKKVIDQPWSVRVLDVRDRDACAKQRVPGAECVPPEDLANLGLQYAPGKKLLVVMGEGDLEAAPEETLAYAGDLYLLEGGFAAWKTYALEAPEVPGADATPAQRAEYNLRAGLNKALTGKAPPPPPPVKGFVAPKKKGGGGCG